MKVLLTLLITVFTLLATEIRVSKTRILTDYVRDNKKEVVIDTKSKLMWQDDASVKTLKKKWSSAKSHCQALNFAGYDDWYLPSIKELENIAEPENYPKAIVSGFKNIAPYYYWSSSVRKSDSKYAWYVDFKDGYSYRTAKTGTLRVRCVRTGQ